MTLINKRFLALLSLIFGLSLSHSATLNAAPSGKDEASHVQLMFVQSAKEVEFKGNQMTLKGVSPSTLFFSDRPERVTGHLTLPAFLKEWDTGKDSFEKDPPNATLSIFTDKDVQYVVVELMNPKLDGTTLTYDVRVLQGTPPAKGGISSLFIDWVTVGFGPRPYYYGYGGGYCHRNWYTGGVYCARPGYWYRPPYWAY